MKDDFKRSTDDHVTYSKYGDMQCQTTGASVKSSAQVAVWAVPLALPQSSALKRKVKRLRDSPVSIRITAAERSSLCMRAQATGISVNAYLKACALKGEYVPPYPPDILKELFRVRWELTKQGHNLNQIAKQLNDGSLMPGHGLGNLDAIRLPLSRALDAVGKVLTWGKIYPE